MKHLVLHMKKQSNPDVKKNDDYINNFMKDGSINSKKNKATTNSATSTINITHSDPNKTGWVHLFARYLSLFHRNKRDRNLSAALTWVKGNAHDAYAVQIGVCVVWCVCCCCC
jgi:hypothetical protein